MLIYTASGYPSSCKVFVCKYVLVSVCCRVASYLITEDITPQVLSDHVGILDHTTMFFAIKVHT